MLIHLSVRDFVLVESLSLDLHDGLTTLTGETGAGKSILLDAVGLLLGDRGDNRFIRQGAERCELAMAYDVGDLKPAQDWLRAHDIPLDEDEPTLLLRRVIGSNGRSKCYINDSLQSVSQLKSIGELLIDIHGQNAHQSLTKSSVQRQILDATISDTTVINAVRDAYQAYEAKLTRLQQAVSGAKDNAERLEFARFQLDELDNLNTTIDEIQALDEEQNTLAHSEQLISVSQHALNNLREQEYAVERLLDRSAQDCRKLAKVTPIMAEISDLLDSALIQVNEAGDSLEKYVNSSELDPQRLEWVEARLADIFRLAKKHHITPEELPEKQASLASEVAELSDLSADPEALQADVDKALKAYQKMADKLTLARQKSAEKLDQKITAIMQTLGMKGGEFFVKLEPNTSEETSPKPSATGNEKVRFWVAANPGQAAGPLGEIASGGEMARISLAIQVASAGSQSTPTLIFDEVDTGIGGSTAAIVGKRMRELAKHQQILCVTHLPQVAASGHQQLVVQKTTASDNTHTQVVPLDESTRIDEIARMLGSETLTDSARSNAQEMIRLQSS